jgi:hypothetical protein
VTQEYLGVKEIYHELPTTKRFIAPFKHKVGSRIIGISHINEQSDTIIFDKEIQSAQQKRYETS